MSDDSTLIVVPTANVTDPDHLHSWSQEVLDWMEQNLRTRFGSASWHFHDDIKGVPHSSFNMVGVPNETRRAFAEKFGGFLKTKRSRLFRANKKKGEYTVYLPNDNICRQYGMLRDEVLEWLNSMVTAQKGYWSWSVGFTQDDISYSGFTLTEVDEDTALLLKITFG